jgi:hypothetical protein
MKSSFLPVLLSLAALLVAGAGCGSPEVASPDSLEVVFLPLSGARDVPLDADAKVYFNGNVDSSTVTGTSVFLESATLNWNATDNKGTCEGAWSAVAGQPAVDGAMVTLTPDADLSETTCYRLTCTTTLRGTELGPLRALPCNPDETDSCRRDVGAEQIFWTIIP